MGQIFPSFTGVNLPLSGKYTDVRGLYPGPWSITCVPQSLVVLDGVFSLTDGEGGTLVLPGARVDVGLVRYGRNGFIEHLPGFDLRWKWEFGELFGEYNVRRYDNTVEPETEKTPRELVDLCFAAWGITDADTTAVPTEDRPYVRWERGYHSVRGELRRLLDRYGLEVIIDWTVPRPIVVTLGVGLNLPDTRVVGISASVDPGDAPRHLKVVTGPDLYQMRFKLDAMAEDVDGKVYEHESASLSYRPASGWEATVADPYEPLDEDTATEDEIEAAKRSLYKLFQISAHADGKMIVPGYGNIDSIHQCLPLRDELLDGAGFTESGRLVHSKWHVIGKWFLDEDGQVPENSDAFSLVPYPATLDKETGRVRFTRPMVQLNSDGNWEPAELYLVASFSVRDANTGEPTVHVREQQISDNLTAPRVERFDEIRRQRRANYEDGTNVVESVSDNVLDVESQIGTIFDLLRSQYATRSGLVVDYEGIIPLRLDGMRTQMEYQVTPAGAFTKAAVNAEPSAAAPRIRELRRRAKLEGGWR